MINLSPKDPSEIIPITFDFSSLVATVTSATVVVLDKTGTDVSGSMLSGSKTLSGATVVQKIQAGSAGQSYRIKVTADGTEGRFVLIASLPVELAENS